MSECKIPDSEILQDIADTQIEILKMQREEEGLRLIGDRMSIFKADARRHGINERKTFILKLETILSERQTK